MVRIGIDAMGGDFAPEVAIEGAIMSLKYLDKESRIVLFGDEKRIIELLKKHNCSADNFDIVATTQVIEMGDHPAKAFISKRDSSITVGFNYLSEGKIDGFASAGSTGAMMVGSMQVIKPIEGVIRPVLATLIPTVSAEHGIQRAVLMDVGLNVDAKPEVLAQYGLLGSIYAKSALNMENPRVALLNIGEEESKGNAAAKAAYKMLAEEKEINFVGNIEGKEFSLGKADVIVCDGFMGNVLLKLSESLRFIAKARKIDDEFLDNLNYEIKGGTPALGVNDVVIVGHGSSTVLALRNMVHQTELSIKSGYAKDIRDTFAKRNTTAE